MTSESNLLHGNQLHRMNETLLDSFIIPIEQLLALVSTKSYSVWVRSGLLNNAYAIYLLSFSYDPCYIIDEKVKNPAAEI